MSLMSQWYFTELATVWPYLGRNQLTQAVSYGAPLVIRCGIEGDARLSRDANGEEFTVTTTYYTGWSGIKAMDRIHRGAHAEAVPPGEAEEIRAVRRHGMAAFGYDDEYTAEV